MAFNKPSIKQSSARQAKEENKVKTLITFYKKK